MASDIIQCESKKSPPRFSEFFRKRLGIFNQFLHTYYTIISTLEYKFLVKYLQLWQSHTKRDHLAKFYISLEL